MYFIAGKIHTRPTTSLGYTEFERHIATQN